MIGQRYDGTAIMIESYSGLQSRIKAKSSNDEYVHCANKDLNLQ